MPIQHPIPPTQTHLKLFSTCVKQWGVSCSYFNLRFYGCFLFLFFVLLVKYNVTNKRWHGWTDVLHQLEFTEMALTRWTDSVILFTSFFYHWNCFCFKEVTCWSKGKNHEWIPGIASLCECMKRLWEVKETRFATGKMPRLCALLALLFAAGCSLCAADVGTFTPCLQFFYRSWPPKGLAGTPICQRFINKYRFATLYSRPRRSPWFSAYLYTVPAGKRPSASWKFEPQVRVWIIRVCLY